MMCVYVVVDRVAAETHCTAADGTAAEALAQRATDLNRPAPRYKGNFLCGIDGYPESPECGDDPPNPYWSVWYYSGGKWVYSSLGVADLMVEDRDKDGHPDPLGFRYLKVDEEKLPPRTTPAYPKPTPTRTVGPTRSAVPTSAAPRPAASGATSRGAVATSAPGVRSASPSAVADDGAGATPSETTGSVVDAAAGEPAKAGGGGGFPVGTAAGALLASGLIGAAVFRFRRPS